MLHFREQYPVELYYHITKHCDLPTLRTLRKTSRLFYHLATMEEQQYTHPVLYLYTDLGMGNGHGVTTITTAGNLFRIVQGYDNDARISRKSIQKKTEPTEFFVRDETSLKTL